MVNTTAENRGGRILIDHVEKVYDPEGVNVHALHECSADIKPGEFAMIVGPSGCGKTTLLNAIAGFENATGGAIHLDGEMIASPEMIQLPGADRMVVFQGGALFPWKTVLNNIIYGPVMQGKMAVDEAVSEARNLMERLGLSRSIEDLYPDSLSSGMRRQVEIIRALVNDPRVLLLDEPFRALDSMTKGLMHEYLLGVFEMTHKTIFFITHDLEEAVFLADRIYIMTTRPGTFKAVIDVDISRPRDFRVQATERFAAIKERVTSEVEEETMKAFEAGERELA
ncbi:MAG: ABC transporter ATP-binding protein [Desulfobacteraceae bacterium]|nr:MAG: ABC transporter ATP-binding protein [Desulfobacteraceae bacterium]